MEDDEFMKNARIEYEKWENEAQDEDVYTDICNFDLGTELEKEKSEKKQLEENICQLQKENEQLTKVIGIFTNKQETLTTNISSLYLTAKTEIERKDRIISELRTELEDFKFRRVGKRRFDSNLEYQKPPKISKTEENNIKKEPCSGFNGKSSLQSRNVEPKFNQIQQNKFVGKTERCKIPNEVKGVDRTDNFDHENLYHRLQNNRDVNVGPERRGDFYTKPHRIDLDDKFGCKTPNEVNEINRTDNFDPENMLHRLRNHREFNVEPERRGDFYTKPHRVDLEEKTRRNVEDKRSEKSNSKNVDSEENRFIPDRERVGRSRYRDQDRRSDHTRSKSSGRPYRDQNRRFDRNNGYNENYTRNRENRETNSGQERFSRREDTYYNKYEHKFMERNQFRRGFLNNRNWDDPEFHSTRDTKLPECRDRNERDNERRRRFSTRDRGSSSTNYDYDNDKDDGSEHRVDDQKPEKTRRRSKSESDSRKREKKTDESDRQMPQQEAIKSNLDVAEPEVQKVQYTRISYAHYRERIQSVQTVNPEEEKRKEKPEVKLQDSGGLLNDNANKVCENVSSNICETQSPPSKDDDAKSVNTSQLTFNSEGSEEQQTLRKIKKKLRVVTQLENKILKTPIKKYPQGKIAEEKDMGKQIKVTNVFDKKLSSLFDEVDDVIYSRDFQPDVTLKTQTNQKNATNEGEVKNGIPKKTVESFVRVPNVDNKKESKKSGKANLSKTEAVVENCNKEKIEQLEVNTNDFQAVPQKNAMDKQEHNNETIAAIETKSNSEKTMKKIEHNVEHKTDSANNVLSEPADTHEINKRPTSQFNEVENVICEDSSREDVKLNKSSHRNSNEVSMNDENKILNNVPTPKVVTDDKKELENSPIKKIKSKKDKTSEITAVMTDANKKEVGLLEVDNKNLQIVSQEAVIDNQNISNPRNHHDPNIARETENNTLKDMNKSEMLYSKTGSVNEVSSKPAMNNEIDKRSSSQSDEVDDVIDRTDTSQVDVKPNAVENDNSEIETNNQIDSKQNKLNQRKSSKVDNEVKNKISSKAAESLVSTPEVVIDGRNELKNTETEKNKGKLRKESLSETKKELLEIDNDKSQAVFQEDMKDEENVLNPTHNREMNEVRRMKNNNEKSMNKIENVDRKTGRSNSVLSDPALNNEIDKRLKTLFDEEDDVTYTRDTSKTDLKQNVPQNTNSAIDTSKKMDSKQNILNQRKSGKVDNQVKNEISNKEIESLVSTPKDIDSKSELKNTQTEKIKKKSRKDRPSETRDVEENRIKKKNEPQEKNAAKGTGNNVKEEKKKIENTDLIIGSANNDFFETAIDDQVDENLLKEINNICNSPPETIEKISSEVESFVKTNLTSTKDGKDNVSKPISINPREKRFKKEENKKMVTSKKPTSPVRKPVKGSETIKETKTMKIKNSENEINKEESVDPVPLKRRSRSTSLYARYVFGSSDSDDSDEENIAKTNTRRRTNSMSEKTSRKSTDGPKKKKENSKKDQRDDMEKKKRALANYKIPKKKLPTKEQLLNQIEKEVYEKIMESKNKTNKNPVEDKQQDVKKFFLQINRQELDEEISEHDVNSIVQNLLKMYTEYEGKKSAQKVDENNDISTKTSKTSRKRKHSESRKTPENGSATRNKYVADSKKVEKRHYTVPSNISVVSTTDAIRNILKDAHGEQKAIEKHVEQNSTEVKSQNDTNNGPTEENKPVIGIEQSVKTVHEDTTNKVMNKKIHILSNLVLPPVRSKKIAPQNPVENCQKVVGGPFKDEGNDLSTVVSSDGVNMETTVIETAVVPEIPDVTQNNSKECLAKIKKQENSNVDNSNELMEISKDEESSNSTIILKEMSPSESNTGKRKNKRRNSGKKNTPEPQELRRSKRNIKAESPAETRVEDCSKEEKTDPPLQSNPAQICSFENILEHNNSLTFPKTLNVQPSLHLTHEGEIPVLNLDENHFSDLPNEIILSKNPDKNIIRLLDSMNISNMECDIQDTEEPVKGKEGVEAKTVVESSNESLTFENFLGKASSTPFNAKAVSGESNSDNNIANAKAFAAVGKTVLFSLEDNVDTITSGNICLNGYVAVQMDTGNVLSETCEKEDILENGGNAGNSGPVNTPQVSGQIGFQEANNDKDNKTENSASTRLSNPPESCHVISDHKDMRNSTENQENNKSQMNNTTINSGQNISNKSETSSGTLARTMSYPRRRRCRMVRIA